MSAAFTRSTTGCLACKTKRKKCDETKPHCLRCQKSRTECPGYIYTHDPTKPNRKVRTLPGPRTVLGRSRDTARQEISLQPKIEGLDQDQSPLDNGRMTSGVSWNELDSSTVENHTTISNLIDISNQCSDSGLLWRPSTNFSTSYPSVAKTVNHDTISPLPNTSVGTPLTSGQASLLAALFSLGQPQDVDPPSQNARYTTGVPLLTNWPPPDAHTEGDVTTHAEEDPGCAVDVIRRELVLDSSAKSNALPFILQAYAAWVQRMAFDPVKLTDTTRDLVFRQFEDGEQSRWTIAALANVGCKIGSEEFAEDKYTQILSRLQTVVRRRLGTVKSLHNRQRADLVKALDCAVETMLIHFFVSPIMEAMTLRQEAAPIFRQLCPEPPDAPIDLLSILQHPLSCLRQYVQMDVFSSVIMGIPSSFRYKITTPANQPSGPFRPISASQGEGIVQWLHGVPNEMILLFAKMKEIQQGGITLDSETVASLERDIRDLPSFTGSSSEPFLTIMRSMVQECWRQAAYVYLYTAVCGDPYDTFRVQEAFKRYMRLLKGTKPGRLPDEFLPMNLVLVAPAARRPRDREVIRQRILGIHALGKTFRANNNFIQLIEDNWARADAERGQIVWPNGTVSRDRVTGV